MPYTVHTFILVSFIIHWTYGSIGPPAVGPMLPMNPHFLGPPLPPLHMIHKPFMGPRPMMNGPLIPSMGPIVGPLPSAMMFGPHIKARHSPSHFIMKSAHGPRRMAPVKRNMSPPNPRKRMMKRPRRIIIVRKFPRRWRLSNGYEHGGRRGRRPQRYYDEYGENIQRNDELVNFNYRGNRHRNAFSERTDTINSFEPSGKFDGSNTGNMLIPNKFSDIFKPARFGRNNDSRSKTISPVERNNIDGNSISKSYPMPDTFSTANLNNIGDTIQPRSGLSLPVADSPSSKLTLGGTTLRDEESMVSFDNRKTDNWKQPRLLETQAKGNRIEARRTPLGSGKFQESSRLPSLSGNTLDFSGSPVISSIYNSVTDAIAEKTVDSNIQKVSGNLNIDAAQATYIKAPKRLRGVKPLELSHGFAGSLIDFTTNYNDNSNANNDAPVKVDGKAATKVETIPLPTEKQKFKVPLAKDPMTDAPLVIVDDTGVDGGIGQYNIVTLQERQFAALESVLQSGKAVSEEMINSIIGGSTGSAVESINVSSQDPLIVDADLVANQVALDTAPHIYILNGKQAKQIAGDADLSASGLDPTLLKSVVAQASMSTSGKQHPDTGEPHFSHNGHGIVGVVGEPVSTITVKDRTDIVGLFSVPGDLHSPNIPASVTNIPKSIGARMHHSGKPHCK